MLTPNDLHGWDGFRVGTELYGAPEHGDAWWSLTRTGLAELSLREVRLGRDFRATHGWLIALQEVADEASARAFCGKNRIRILADGALVWGGHGVAEFGVRVAGCPLTSELEPSTDFGLRFADGVVATLGPASLQYRRLILAPSGESFDIPDPATLYTLVLQGVAAEDAAGRAEAALFHLRRVFPSIWLRFWRALKAPYGEVPALEGTEVPRLVDGIPTPKHVPPIAFFNRGREEADNLSAFHFRYRVLEYYFDHKLEEKVAAWRSDAKLSERAMLGRLRGIQSEREDQWALRTLLEELKLELSVLLRARDGGLIATPDLTYFKDALYDHRNAIAHGRDGERFAARVPLAWPDGNQAERDFLWAELVSEVAERVVLEWAHDD